MTKANLGVSALRPEGAAEARPVLVPAHGKGRLHPFQPGQSGNPSGKGGLYQEAQRLFRDASPAAARRLIVLMDSDDERVALMAADKVLERAWGKPREITDDAELDPVIEERRKAARDEVFRLLEQMAVQEPLSQGQSNQRQASPSRREPRHPTTKADPPPPDEW